MAANLESVVTANTQCLKKVSKPTMEKKRRARINKCLNQLQSLLESVYCNNIRKRKWEKADILELTVKHLRDLQNPERGTYTFCDSTEYRAGYKSCITGISLLTETDSDSHATLTHLTTRLLGSRVLHFRTAESDSSSNRRDTSKKINICQKKKISVPEHGTTGSMHMKTRHISRKNANIDQRFLAALKPIYWRPW